MASYTCPELFEEVAVAALRQIGKMSQQDTKWFEEIPRRIGKMGQQDPMLFEEEIAAAALGRIGKMSQQTPNPQNSNLVPYQDVLKNE